MKIIQLDKNTTGHISDEDYAVLRAYANLFCNGAHSLRRGLITQAARNREQTGDIRKVSRHKTELMVDVYRADAAETQLRVIGGALRAKE